MSRAATVLIPSPRCRLSLSPNPAATADLWASIPAGQTVIACSPPPAARGYDLNWREMDATVRLTWPDGADSLVLIGLFSQSSLAPLVLWDLAHACPEGAAITVVDHTPVLTSTPFDKTYYSGWLVEVDDRDPRRRTFRKTGPAPASADSGLDEWSFCLPMGRPDAQVLGRLAERIAGLGLARTEILVACPDEHRHDLPSGIGHVSTPSGATLAAKKNALAKAASLANLCILHDRLAPPRNFRAAVQAFGDDFPICGLQNLAIDPRTQAIARYSDYHVEVGPGADQIAVVGEHGPDHDRLHGDLLDLRQGWRSHFVESPIQEYSANAYVTGSLYLAKRSVWRMCGQNPAIDWASLEDVEFGRRAIRDFGIPMRVNPFAFVRTDRIRPLLAEGARHHLPDTLQEHALRPPAPLMDPARDGAEPYFPISEAAYRERLLRFGQVWAPAGNHDELRRHIARTELGDMRDLANLLVALTHLCQVRQTEAELRRFIGEFTSQLLLSPADRATETDIAAKAMKGRDLIDELVRSSYLVHLLLAGEVRPLFAPPHLTAEDLLTANLLQVWHDPRHGIAFPGRFQDFAEAVKATL